jgi:isoleucyl-tRNA synthetase
MKYPEYPATPVELEEQVLARWREEDLFQRTLEATSSGDEFVFHEGPPTANGRPGIHHVISRTIKDLVCRFQTMHGRHVTRIAGWDTHGLPVEIEAEKKLGINGKREIEELGVARFNEVCRESVFTYVEEWETLSERIAYWLDYSRAYVTFEPPYIETIWWILEQFWNDGLIYRGHRSVPFCPRCGTALSSHEVAQGYQDVEDPSLYFLCRILDDEGEPDGREFVVWTTTPWTVPSNAALALHPDLEYVEVDHGGRRLILAEARARAVFGGDEDGEGPEIARRYTARDLEGVRYERPFDIVAAPPTEAGWTVVLEDFVTAEDGTGIVHMAPAFGADDYAAGQRHSLPFMKPIDDTGRFDGDTALVGGMFVKDADPVLVDDLEKRGLLFRHTKEVHNYPHCWRCGNPLIYMARDSWYIRTTALKKNLLDNNARVHWHPPETGRGRFGEWLEGNVDWALSRERYWGTPLPAWVCDQDDEHVDFIGSYEKLAGKLGRELADPFDPHKPFIDELTWPCPTCDGTMRRTPEVIDVWFDSGSMPWAQWHYPFENADEFKQHFPADFICEAIDQTRGWFYSLMAISTMLRSGPAYRNVVVNDLVLDADGQKMSKSKGNVVNPWDAIAEFGADAIRWYFMTVSQPWSPKRYDPAAVGETARRTFDTLAHTYRFFALYANLDSWSPSDGDPSPSDRPVLDRWILSRVNGLAERVHADMSVYEITRAVRAMGDFVVDDLSNWYVRRGRDRFYGRAGQADAGDTRAAFATLRETLVVLVKLMAPIVPFHADWLHRALTDGASVHLERYPVAAAGGDAPGDRDVQLEHGMDAVRELVRLGRAARERVRIRVRQPLPVLHAVLPDGAKLTDELLAILQDELNIKQVAFEGHAEDLVSYRAAPNFRSIGKRFGARTQAAADRIRALPSDALAAFARGAALSIELDGETYALDAEEVELQEQPRGDLVVESDGGYTIALDPTVDEPLRLEGVARELVNRIQRLRRDAGLDVSDRIRLAIYGNGGIREAVERHGESIARDTLAVDLVCATEPAEDEAGALDEVDLDGTIVRIGLARA